MSQLVVTWLLCAVVMASAVWVVALRNLFRAALSLGLVLVGVAGLFLTLEAEFLAFAQILVYVGAILTLVIFAIMLTTRPPASRGSARAGAISAVPSDRSRPPLPALLLSGALFALLVSGTSALLPPRVPLSIHGQADASALGQALVTTFVLPFEVISVVFVAAMVGGIAVAASQRRTDQAS